MPESTEENVCPHCGEAKPTQHVAVLEDEPYCDECWEEMCEEFARAYLEPGAKP